VNQTKPKSTRPRIGEANLGSLIGAIVGSIGGLIAIGLAPAIVARNPHYFFTTPVLSFIGWVVGGLAGWFVGGQIGPRLERALGERNGNVLGGILGGLVPAISIAVWSWRMATGQ
jgi:hypothetical protein